MYSACRGVIERGRLAGGGARIELRLRSGYLTQAGSRDPRHTSHPHNLEQVSLHEVNHLSRHRLHGDFDVDRVAGAMRPHAIRYEVALCVRLQQAGQQSRRRIRVEQEADENSRRLRIS